MIKMKTMKSTIKILKIGGSIITDKNRSALARPDEITRVANEVASSPEDLVLVHGAGSFGHIPAQRYGLPHKFNPTGLQRTHSCVARLNQMMVDALDKEGANPMPVHPLSCVVLKGGRIERFCIEPILEMIRHSLLPVLHGDVAMDMIDGASIVSGDQLVSHLARALKAQVVAVGTNVDGVIFQGEPLFELAREDLMQISESLKGSSGVDVTGGMRGKLLELLDLADSGIDSIIFNAGKKGQIEKALRGEPIGTAVRRSR
jgi:isopentenyl phosphate kinase